MNENHSEFLVSYIVDEMTKFLIQDRKVSIENALSMIYNSITYEKLLNTENELYIQSPAYIYEIFDREYRTGAFC